MLLPFGLGYFIAMAYRSVTAILAHPLATELHLGAVEVGFVTSTFMLTFALAQLPPGALLDSLGARKTRSLFFCIGAVGIIIFGLASSVTLLSVGRAILGIGMAGGLTSRFSACLASSSIYGRRVRDRRRQSSPTKSPSPTWSCWEVLGLPWFSVPAAHTSPSP